MSPTVVTTVAIAKLIMSSKHYDAVNPNFLVSKESKYESSCKRWWEDCSWLSSSSSEHSYQLDSFVAALACLTKDPLSAIATLQQFAPLFTQSHSQHSSCSLREPCSERSGSKKTPTQERSMTPRDLSFCHSRYHCPSQRARHLGSPIATRDHDCRLATGLLLDIHFPVTFWGYSPPGQWYGPPSHRYGPSGLWFSPASQRDSTPDFKPPSYGPLGSTSCAPNQSSCSLVQELWWGGKWRYLSPHTLQDTCNRL